MPVQPSSTVTVKIRVPSTQMKDALKVQGDAIALVNELSLGQGRPVRVVGTSIA